MIDFHKAHTGYIMRDAVKLALDDRRTSLQEAVVVAWRQFTAGPDSGSCTADDLDAIKRHLGSLGFEVDQ